MQLKRDTEYAMRIVACIAEHQRSGGGEKGGILSSEVSMRTLIPKPAYERICTCLEEHEIIRRELDKRGDLRLVPGKNFQEQNLLSISRAVEGNMQLFIIFDKDTSLMKNYGNRLSDLQGRFEALLEEVTLTD